MIENKKAYQDKLFGFIDSVQGEIDIIQQDFFRKWNLIIKRNLNLSCDIHIENFIDICGGYWLTEELYFRMDKELQNFYDKRAIKKNGKFFLRGYDYYEIDPLMHHKTKVYDWKDIKLRLAEKFADYGNHNTFSYLNDERISFVNWMGTIGRLEYLFSDTTSLQWFLFKNEKSFQKTMGSGYFQTIRELEALIDMLGKALAYLLRFEFKQTYTVLTEHFSADILLDVCERLMQTDLGHVDKYSIRAVREGDSICLIYAAYLMKLEPFCQKNNLRYIHLVSNAFGAMNIGVILKYLIESCSGADCYNILYAQNRAVEDTIYGENFLEQCSILGTKPNAVNKKLQAVFVVDDSIFSGSSYMHIKEFIQEECSIYLLPLTLNCDCLKYCRRGIKESDDIDEIAHQAAVWSSEVGDTLPAFSSFWDFCRKAPENQIATDNMKLREVLDGDDGLTKHLWAIFEAEIFQE